jgi:hypothetical protein
MRLETLIPLGKVDPGLRTPETPLDIHAVADTARLLEEVGYGGLVVEKDDPFAVLTLAAQATERLRLGTAVAIAFPRSPTITALTAWTLQKLSRGRFTLGLGTQVKGHIERRYGMTWSAAGPWMREYVQAVRAVWECWQNSTPLRHHGEHYDLSLMVPLFDAGPIDHPEIPIHLAAVGSVMCAVAGEVADGMRPHPVCTPAYIRDVMPPAARRGASKHGRSLNDIRVCMKPLWKIRGVGGDFLREPGFEHESQRVFLLDRFQLFGAGDFECVGVGAVRRHAVVQAEAAGDEAIWFGVVDTVHESHELAHTCRWRIRSTSRGGAAHTTGERPQHTYEGPTQLRSVRPSIHRGALGFGVNRALANDDRSAAGARERHHAREKAGI